MITATGPIYEDWYLVENFAALESLNEGAVSGKNRSPHDSIAQRARGGSGALYRLRAGEPHIAKVRMALWFSKPRGLPYSEFYADVRPEALDSGGGLWDGSRTFSRVAVYCSQTGRLFRRPWTRTKSNWNRFGAAIDRWQALARSR